jgi:hypothetical protein
VHCRRVVQWCNARTVLPNCATIMSLLVGFTNQYWRSLTCALVGKLGCTSILLCVGMYAEARSQVCRCRCVPQTYMQPLLVGSLVFDSVVFCVLSTCFSRAHVLASVGQWGAPLLHGLVHRRDVLVSSDIGELDDDLLILCMFPSAFAVSSALSFLKVL